MFTPQPCVTCHVSHVMCQVSRVTCQVSCVTFYFFIFFLQIGGASRWRVFYQRGLPRLVLTMVSLRKSLKHFWTNTPCVRTVIKVKILFQRETFGIAWTRTKKVKILEIFYKTLFQPNIWTKTVKKNSSALQNWKRMYILVIIVFLIW